MAFPWGTEAATSVGLLDDHDHNQQSTLLTVRDSLLRPLVTKLKPCVSMATPVRWICSSTYLIERLEGMNYVVPNITLSY